MFDGIYMNSDVYVNGHALGHWPYGYTTLTYDVTPYLNYGSTPNVVAVRVDDSAQPASRWYGGAGIYRNVWITATDPVHVAQWGTFVTTPNVTPTAASVWARTEVRNETAAPANATVVSQIIDANGTIVTSGEAQIQIPRQRHAIRRADPGLGEPPASGRSTHPTFISCTPKSKSPAKSLMTTTPLLACAALTTTSTGDFS